MWNYCGIIETCPSACGIIVELLKLVLQHVEFQMLSPTRELSEVRRLRLGSILGRYNSPLQCCVPFVLSYFSRPDTKLYCCLFILGWTSFWERLVLPRLWRRPDLGSLRCDGSSLHRWTDPVGTQSLRRGHLACDKERVNLLHRQRQNHQAASQL